MTQKMGACDNCTSFALIDRGARRRADFEPATHHRRASIALITKEVPMGVARSSDESGQNATSMVVFRSAEGDSLRSTPGAGPVIPAPRRRINNFNDLRWILPSSIFRVTLNSKPCNDVTL